MLRAAGAVVGLALAAAALPVQPAHAACSVFSRHPCNPTFCSVFSRRPCVPQFDYPIGQDLRLTISSRAAETDGAHAPDGQLNTIADLFAALRACWAPPEHDKASAGVQVSVRLSFKRDGEIVGTPRWTYATPTASHEARDTYRDSVTVALARCTPLPFSKGLGGAIAGRPVAIRFVEDRTL